MYLYKGDVMNYGDFVKPKNSDVVAEVKEINHWEGFAVLSQKIENRDFYEIEDLQVISKNEPYKGVNHVRSK